MGASREQFADPRKRPIGLALLDDAKEGIDVRHRQDLPGTDAVAHRRGQPGTSRQRIEGEGPP